MFFLRNTNFIYTMKLKNRNQLGYVMLAPSVEPAKSGR